MIKKYLKITLLILPCLLSACNNSQDEQTIKVGTISGPETALMEVAQNIAKAQYGLDINIVEFTDYVIPNTALNDGSIDAHATVTLSFFDAILAAKGYDLTPIGLTFIYPMGIYSNKINDLTQLADKASVAIPNDPSNEERALLLLQEAGLITLDSDYAGHASVNNVRTNPKNLHISVLEAAQLPRVLADVDIAVINTNYAVPAGLSPTRDAVFIEGEDSPYVNIIAVRSADKEDVRFQQLVKAYQSQAVIDKAQELFHGQAIPAW